MNNAAPYALLGCTVIPVRFRWRGQDRRVTAWRVWRGFELIGTVSEVPGGYSPTLKPTLVCGADTAITYLAALALEVPCSPNSSTRTSVTTSRTSAPRSPAASAGSSSTSPT